jgi:hypothetical protein
MLGKQRLHNISDGICDKTFKNLLRGQEKVVKKKIYLKLSPQRDYMITPVKETNISPRAGKSYDKFWNKSQSIDERNISIINKKYVNNYVKGQLKSHIDFNPPGKVKIVNRRIMMIGSMQ